MKTYYLLLFVILTLQCQVEGGLVTDFLGKVQDSVQVVRTDIRKVWRGNPNNSANTDPQHGNTDTVPDGTAQSQPEVTSEGTNNGEKPQVPENQQPEQVTESPSTTLATKGGNATQEATTTNPTSTTTDGKDGRENFKGGCSSGYYRTPDGRCKPSF